jgi:hypothetical protein
VEEGLYMDSKALVDEYLLGDLLDTAIVDSI